MCFLSCYSAVCNVCADPATENDAGYDESNYRVGKCPGGKCINSGGSDYNASGLNNEVSSNRKSDEDEEGKQQYHPFFSSS